VRAHALGAVVLAALALAAGADAADPGVRQAVREWVPRVQGAGTVQAAYDSARELHERLRLAYPPSSGCRPLYRAALEYATAHVAYAERVDRLRPLRSASERTHRAYRALTATGLTCRAGRYPRWRPRDVILFPRSGSAFFGVVVDETIQGSTEAQLYANGRLAARVRNPPANVRFVLNRPPGRYDLEVRTLRGRRIVWRSYARDVRLLPRSGRRARAEQQRDHARSTRLAAIGRSFRGHAGIWVHDLVTGSTASWNADARFPAASTVKLGVLAETLRRFDPRRADAGVAYDLGTLTRWSSNLAANRLVAKIGGPEAAQRALARLGARSSTYPGTFRVGTSVDADAPRPPPPVSSRVTTAHDLGRVLYTLHAAALGNRRALARCGFDRDRARYALGLLLRSEPVGNNLGLLRPALGPVSIAEKNGWTSEVRHTAAIVYAPRGPVIVVVLTYRPGISRAEAIALGRRVVSTLP
jgi:beta-lactamase class A